MRSDVKWSVAVALGLVLSAGTYWTTGWRDLAIGNGVLVALATGRSIGAYAALDERIERWNDAAAVRELDASVAVVALAIFYVATSFDGPIAERASVAVLVTAVAAGALASGIEVAVEYLDDGRTGEAPGQSARS